MKESYVVQTNHKSFRFIFAQNFDCGKVDKSTYDKYIV